VVRLAARGRRLSERDFIRIAVLRAACQTRGVFDLPANSDVAVEAACATLGAAAARLADVAGSAAPGEAGQIAAQVLWKVDWDFQRRPQQDKKLWFQATQEEQSALRQLKVTAGEIVHGTRKDSPVSRQMVDWLREQAWMTPSNRAARKAGLPVIPLPDGSARIDDGVLSLAISDSVARVALRARNRNAYPGSGMFKDAALEQVASGRWSLYYSVYERLEPANRGCRSHGAQGKARREQS
jgi:hypothetical protein